MNKAESKKRKLKNILKSYGKIMIAFSGGVDSTFLLKTAKEVCGDNVVAVTLISPVFPESESDFAKEFCIQEGIEHKIIKVDLLDNEEFTDNNNDRCYTCKKLLFGQILVLADEMGIDRLCEGSVTDDDDDYRPGKRAIKELNIASPLKEAGLAKEEIRLLSHQVGLSTWKKPSMACLASRIPYGKEITDEKLRMIERAENYLMNLGFAGIRVRMHDDVARIEVNPDDMEKIINEDIRKQVYKKLKEIGFAYVSLDLQGYRTGSMNEPILE